MSHPIRQFTLQRDDVAKVVRRRTPADDAWEIIERYDAATDPTVGDDAGDGYTYGSLWHNSTDKKVWLCTDPTVGAAVWRNLGATPGSTQAFGTISVAGQSDVVADAAPDTLTLAGSNGIAITTSTTTDSVTIAPTYGSSANTICEGNDGRLSDARTPTAHTHGAADLTDEGDFYAKTIGTGLSNSAGTISVLYGSAAATACVGNDSRLSNSRTPTTHAASHKSGQSDEIKLDELAPPTNTTTLNATTSAHGLLPILNNNAYNYLNGQGAWAGLAADASAYLALSSGNPFINFDTNDYVIYDRTGNDYYFYIGSAAVFLVRANGTIHIAGQTSDPGSPAAGQIYFNSSTGKFRGYTGSGWTDFN